MVIDRVTDVPTARRRQLGRALRKARQDAGFTQAAAASMLGCSQGKINKIETKLVTVKPDELEQMITIYGLAPEPAAELRELVAQDQRDGPRRTGVPVAWSAFVE